MSVSVDLWPHRLFWMGDPRAVAVFSVKVPKDEPGPWLGRRAWRAWRQRAISTERLDRWLRNNKPHLHQDAFASINRFYGWRRGQEYVVRLGAVFVDIDCGRNVFDYAAEDAADVLSDLVEAGRLAQPSMLQFSGRGLWAFWLLRDEQDPSTTPFANADNRELWTLLQQRTADTIATEYPDLKLDRTAGEFTRVTRLHGSVMAAWNGVRERCLRAKRLGRPGSYLDGRAGEGWTTDNARPRGEGSTYLGAPTSALSKARQRWRTRGPGSLSAFRQRLVLLRA